MQPRNTQGGRGKNLPPRQRQQRPQGQRPRALRNTGARGNSGLALNAIQTTYVNPNRFWEIGKASTPGGMIIKAREPVGSLTLSGTGTGQFLPLNINGAAFLDCNPSNSSFPRLSYISLAYELYKFKSFRVDFMSSQPTTVAGQIILYADYIASDTVVLGSQAALANITSVIANIYSSVSMVALGSLSRLPKFVINESSDTNINQTSQMKIWAFCQGFTGAAASSVGEIMIDYEIELFTPAQLVGGTGFNQRIFFPSIEEKMLALEALNHLCRNCDTENCHVQSKNLRKILRIREDQPYIQAREEVLPTTTDLSPVVEDTTVDEGTAFPQHALLSAPKMINSKRSEPNSSTLSRK